MINNPYLVCWFRWFRSLIILMQALSPPPPPCPHPLSCNSFPCMWSFCLSSFPTDALSFSALDLTADSCILTTVLLPLTIPLPLLCPPPPFRSPPPPPPPSP